MKNRNMFQRYIVIFVIATIQACSFVQPIIPATSTPTVTRISTATLKPTLAPTKTKTPRPTFTPNAIATQNYEDVFSQVQKFVDEGFIPGTKGQYRTLEDFDQSVAKINWLQYWYYDFKMENFVLKAHAEWSSAIDTTDTSGCGIVFALQKKSQGNDYYSVILDKSRVYFTTIDKGYYSRVGKTRGAGVLHFGNPASANFTVLVYDYRAYVYVDDEFIGEYTLAKSKDLNGYLGYGLISGTNRDYGTRCKITNTRIWEIEE